MNSKPIFKSKTALAGVLTAVAGLVGDSFPQVGEFIAANANTILIGLGIAAVVLRKVTSGRVLLFPD